LHGNGILLENFHLSLPMLLFCEEIMLMVPVALDNIAVTANVFHLRIFRERTTYMY